QPVPARQRTLTGAARATAVALKPADMHVDSSRAAGPGGLPRQAAPEQKWPQSLWVVRHGQSAGNVARDQAEAAGHHLIDIADRDMDVPLSALGERQAEAVGEWFGQLPADQRPNVVLCSPYVRALETARLLLAAAQISDATFVCDERLR